MENPLEAVRTAIMTNDVSLLSEWIDSIESINVMIDDAPLLFMAVHYDKKDIFDYLIAHPDIDVNLRNRYQSTALMEVICQDNQYYILKLLAKGANMDTINGGTILHWCIDKSLEQVDSSLFWFEQYDRRTDYLNRIEIAEAALEAGVPINAVNHRGQTPLNYACKLESSAIYAAEWIDFLLFYGADTTISNDEGYVPVFQILENPFIPDDSLYDILWALTFDKYSNVLGLRTVAQALICSLYPIMHKNLTTIHYKSKDLIFFVDNLYRMKHLYLFLERFSHIIMNLDLEYLLRQFSNSVPWSYNIFQILPIILNNPNALNSIQNIRGCCITNLLECAQHYEVSLSEVTNVITIMLSYGLSADLYDLHSLYEFHRYCELFHLCLHMPYIPLIPDRQHRFIFAFKNFMVILYTKIHCHWEEIWELAKVEFSYYESLYYFGNNCKITNCILQRYLKFRPEREVVLTPRVPSLLELSRNATHEFIVSKWKPQTPGEYYSIVKHMGIPNKIQKILSFEEKLYSFDEIQEILSLVILL